MIKNTIHWISPDEAVPAPEETGMVSTYSIPVFIITDAGIVFLGEYVYELKEWRRSSTKKPVKNVLGWFPRTRSGIYPRELL